MWEREERRAVRGRLGKLCVGLVALVAVPQLALGGAPHKGGRDWGQRSDPPPAHEQAFDDYLLREHQLDQERRAQLETPEARKRRELADGVPELHTG